MLRDGLRFARIVTLIALLLSFGLGMSFAQKVPAPQEVLGFPPGADYRLATYEQAVEYFKALEKSTRSSNCSRWARAKGGGR